jgi:hypothetical protein
MSSLTSRILALLALAPFAVANGAEAGVIGSALSPFRRSLPAQTVQFSGSNCYYAEGWNGRGWYQCGDEWNHGFGWIGPFNLNTLGGPAIRRHHPHGVTVFHPQAPAPVFPGYKPPRGLSAGGAAPSVGLGAGGVPAFGRGPGFRRFGAGGVHTSPGLHAGAATVTPGFAGGGFHGGFGGGNFHQFHGAGAPHVGAPVSPGFAGVGTFHAGGAVGALHIGAPVSPGFARGGGFHGFGGAGSFHGAGVGVPHIGAPVSPGFTGGGGLHGLGGATGVHIGAPVSPGFAGVGTFHAGGAVGALHIGGPASPGFAGGGFHGVGVGGAFQGGGAAFGQGGIGHR